MPLSIEILLVAGCALALALLITCLVLLRQILGGISQTEQRESHLRERMAEVITLLEQSARQGSSEAENLRSFLLQQLTGAREQTHRDLNQLGERFGDLRSKLEQRVGEMQGQVLERLSSGTQDINKNVSEALNKSADKLSERVDKLTAETERRLREISGQVDERLKQGFEKTTSTFSEVLKRLALIDEAQKRITELSTNVVSLQEILADKRSRGAFGEVQLEALVGNALPEQHIALQHTLSNGSRVDCLLRLPPPTGDVCIDAKFPLENYQTMADPASDDNQRLEARRRFKQDIKKHIGDIADKYIIPGETSGGAIMFVPAESVFAEIHAHHGELVRQAHERGVWICSPSTLMAVLTTARAVLRDDALRRQTGLIRQYLIELNTEFGRFRERMNALARHIEKAHDETRRVNITADKISKRFAAIEQVPAEEAALEDSEQQAP